MIGDPSPTLRLRMYDLTGGMCEYCAGIATDLHHKPYRSQKGAANDVDHLLALCRRCHNWSHGLRNKPHERQFQIFKSWYDSLPAKLNSRRDK